MRRFSRPPRPELSGHQPLDAVIEAMREPITRVAPEPTSLSERAARVLTAGPRDARSLMREVCRLDRLTEDAAQRMAEVLLGARDNFVQLDDDRWALVLDGELCLERVSQPIGGAATSELPDATPFQHAARPEATATRNVLSQRYGKRALSVPATRLVDIRFAVVDVETTGSHAGSVDRITEIAIVTVTNGVVAEPWQQLVNPGRLIPPFITGLTGISNAMVANAPRFDDIADEVVSRLDGHVFTAHNAAFDWRFVDNELSRALRTRLTGTSLCTVRLSRKMLPSLPKRSLDRVCAYFGIRIDGRHRAGGDAHATAHVLVRLLEIAHDAGIDTWPQLLKHLNGSPKRTTRPSALPTPVREDTSA